MVSLSHALCILLSIGIGQSLAQNPCEPNPCEKHSYCQQLPDGAGEPFLCIEEGYLLGNCSINTQLTCAPLTRCLEKPDGKSYKCECHDPLAIGNGIRFDKGGSGCETLHKKCKNDKECPQYGFCDTSDSHCKCKEGFKGNGFNCTDIIDCPSDVCDNNAICQDIPGSFTCTCDGARNFRGNGTHCEHKCQSDNDCAKVGGLCNKEAKCLCEPGFTGNGTHCTDVDECALEQDDCPAGADCINNPGGFECICKNGHFGAECILLPTKCSEVKDFVRGNEYRIDPDGTGPADNFIVQCDVLEGVTVTKMTPTITTKALGVRDRDYIVDYKTDPKNIIPLLENSAFCSQNIYYGCSRYHHHFPGTVWYDAYGHAHDSFGGSKPNTCQCGELGTCSKKEAQCECSSKISSRQRRYNYVTDEAQLHDKSHMPFVRITGGPRTGGTRGKLIVNPLVCMDTQAGIPLNCHDAKVNYGRKSSGPFTIDADGDGPAKPLLVYCDMSSDKDTGITIINPDSDKYNMTNSEGETVSYGKADAEQLKALINGSVFCSQSVEFDCQASKLLGNDGGYVSVGSDKRRLDYFPGANGVQGKCGCGATKSCQSPEVTCNCNIEGDDQLRKDFGLIVNKADLPVVHLNGQYGDQKTSIYKVGPLQCAGSQFGLARNCERLRSTLKELHDYTYFIDPDGPKGEVKPFLAECQFIKSPPHGKTILHHTDENTKSIADGDFDLNYLAVNPDQIKSLKDKSSYCYQPVQVDCNKLLLNETGDIIEWVAANDNTTLHSLLAQMITCTDGDGCNCNGVDKTKDDGEILDKEMVPVQKISMAKLRKQLSSGASGAVTIGPMICTEVLPSCESLMKAIVREGGKASSGHFTIDPDGAGGVPAFAVTCHTYKTFVPATPSTNTVPDPNNPSSIKKCVDIKYSDSEGNPISPEQMDALAKVSGDCRQKLSLQCVNAPATGKVSYSTCDGTKQPGWAGSGASDGCACGVTGICDGGARAKCNCDLTDGVSREDSFMIIENNRVPICQVCLEVPPGTSNTSETNTTPMQKFIVEGLQCDGRALPRGYKKTCQLHSTLNKPRSASSINPKPTSIVLEIAGKKIMSACKLHPNRISSMVVNPYDPLYRPTEPGKPVDIKIDYAVVDWEQTKKTMNYNHYCRQKVFFFCAGNQAVETGGENGYYDIDGNVHYDWERIEADSKFVDEACEQHKELCDRCGRPRGYIVTNKQALPITRIKLELTGVTVFVDYIECFDLNRNCQDMRDARRNRGSLYLYSYYIIDPDGPGELFPFVVSCLRDRYKKVYVTQMSMSDPFDKRSFPIKNQPGTFEIPIELDNISPEQARGVVEDSDFCWQNVRYECKHTALLNNGVDPSSYYYLSGSNTPASSFGTGHLTNATGCACGVLGTCVEPGVSCNCDAEGYQGWDQGAVTDKNALPIVQMNVGGQTDSSEVKIAVSPLYCGKNTLSTLPKDCQQASKNDIRTVRSRNYRYLGSGSTLINPDSTKVKPFLVHCDFERLPAGKAVTVVKPNLPGSSPVIDPTNPVRVPYKGEQTEPQLQALIKYSKYCYQGVKIECQGSKVFSGGAYWNGANTNEKQKFWGGGAPTSDLSQVCACGKDGGCGGTDSYSAQVERKCNCDIGDDVPRMDAGIISQKHLLPVSKFFLGNGAQFDKVNLTIGDLVCSQYPLKFNECELGFHDCDPNAVCLDEDKGYACACKKGWQGKSSENLPNKPRANGRQCFDDDECSWNPCNNEQTATCTNTPGSFYCTCKDGYRKKDATTCVDIDECKEGTHNCDENARCENLNGGFRCACNKGYRGDGKTCRAVGECKCFGDPHCLSFDSRWLHYQGLCEYTMSKDNCGNGHEPTYQVLTKYWRKGSQKPGYYSYVESVRILVMGREIKLVQGMGIQVNGILVDQYISPDGITAIRYYKDVVVRAPNGLEVTWDGKDAVTVVVPDNLKGETCGMCGNYNGDPKDDWTIGEACGDKKGQLTHNYELFGNSWAVINSTEVTCKPDCNPEVPPDPTNCDLKELIEFECNKLLNLETSPFKQCLALMTEQDREQFMMSCSYDLCFVNNDFSGSVCSFAETLNIECSTKYSTDNKDWRDNVDACEKPSCANNMEYKSCGPPTQPSCTSLRANITSDANLDACYEGCFCAEGLVMDGNTCVPKGDCGCLYNNQYIKKGELVVNSDCQTKVLCKGGDIVEELPVNCGANEKCKIEDNGQVGCFCAEGFKANRLTGKCEVDPCYNVTCAQTNTECVNGECQCKMGYMGNCNSCMNVDECATGTNNCGKIGQKCTDTAGSFLCECKKGFIPDKNGNCKDIDECLVFSDKCGDNSECTNTLGGYSCECCAGYKKDSKGDCIRDITLKKEGKCCACKGDKCSQSGKVCGSDGVTYNDYRSLAVISCRNGKDNVKVEYEGACQPTCSTVKCKIPYQTCEADSKGTPKCNCPSCKDHKFESYTETVCATNKVTYTSICHMKAATCEAELETQVEAESVGKPCGKGGAPHKEPGPWGDWGECSEPCKQGLMTRSRNTFGDSRSTAVEEVACFSTCADGPCKKNTCTSPGQVCTANIHNATSCTCPVCGDFPKQPVCGRVGTVIQTYDNQCELEAEICDSKTGDYEILEPRACEEKPKNCGQIRLFKYFVDENGCKADRTINVGDCYGGCDKPDKENCCYASNKETASLIMTCPDGTFHRRSESVITKCECKDVES